MQNHVLHGTIGDIRCIIGPMEKAHPYHLFVVEDDPALQEMLSTYLHRQGVAVTAMPQAEEMFRRIKHERPDLVILDVGLPGMNGLDACRQLRAQGDKLPLILLTARSEEIDRVLGLEMGADDYLSKPFSARELLARVRAVLRRSSQPAPAPQAQSADPMIGEYLFAVASRSLFKGNEVRVLNTVEYAILSELVLNPHVPVTRERLLAASHTTCNAVLLRAVDAAIMRLRKALEPDPARPRFIQTVRGQGYVFVPQALSVNA